jgi:hypothetical protein
MGTSQRMHGLVAAAAGLPSHVTDAPKQDLDVDIVITPERRTAARSASMGRQAPDARLTPRSGSNSVANVRPHCRRGGAQRWQPMRVPGWRAGCMGESGAESGACGQRLDARDGSCGACIAILASLSEAAQHVHAWGWGRDRSPRTPARPNTEAGGSAAGTCTGAAIRACAPDVIALLPTLPSNTESQVVSD